MCLLNVFLGLKIIYGNCKTSGKEMNRVHWETRVSLHTAQCNLHQLLLEPPNSSCQSSWNASGGILCPGTARNISHKSNHPKICHVGHHLKGLLRQISRCTARATHCCIDQLGLTLCPLYLHNRGSVVVA